MKAIITSPTRNAMQSGLGKAGTWVLSYQPEAAPAVDPLTGWTGMTDTPQQVKLTFANKDEAIAYAKRNNIIFEVVEPKKREVKPKSYSKNFEFKQEIRP